MSGASYRVLHIGGHGIDALLMRDALSLAGAEHFEVEWCSTLSAGLERLSAHPPSALLLDQRRPGAPGIDGLRQLHAAAPTVPILVVGTEEGADTERQIIAAGAVDHLLASHLDPYWLPRALRHVIERTQSQRACDAEGQRVERLLGAIGVAVLNTDLSGRLTHLNKYAETLTGWSAVEATGRPLQEVAAILTSASREPVLAGLDETLIGDAPSDPITDCVLVRRDGSESAIEYSTSLNHDRLGLSTGVKVVIRDMSVPHAASLRMSYLASHDPLTDLPNRLLLRDRLGRSIALAGRHGRRLAVLYLDLDRFKTINDSLGHFVGDELLSAVARKVTMCVRSSDTVSRQGGDEFVVVLSELEHEEDAAKGAQKIIAALARPHQVGRHELFVTVSIGISVYPDDGSDAGTLLRHADMALYAAKAHGRDCYRFFEPELNLRAIERQNIESGLHTAIVNREFELHYQPKMNLGTGTVIGVEALIRWRHPDRGLVSPAHFIPIAEYCGLIRPIGRWVLREACRQARAWQDAGLAAVPVSVNVSAIEFHAKNFYDHIVDTLNETGLEPDYLELELTESALMTHLDTTTTLLHALKRLGIHISIDDFGTGWSSLSSLRHFPVDVLKIDGSFVQEITAATRVSPLVTALINMGKSLQYRVVAEGVETQAQLDFLQAAGCLEGQGFYFSQPLMPPQFAQVLEARHIQ